MKRKKKCGKEPKKTYQIPKEPREKSNSFHLFCVEITSWCFTKFKSRMFKRYPSSTSKHAHSHQNIVCTLLLWCAPVCMYLWVKHVRNVMNLSKAHTKNYGTYRNIRSKKREWDRIELYLNSKLIQRLKRLDWDGTCHCYRCHIVSNVIRSFFLSVCLSLTHSLTRPLTVIFLLRLKM